MPEAVAMLSSDYGADEWELIWADEFDYTGLPDPERWDYEVGFIRNGEVQYYTRARKENAMVENGMLSIAARKEQYEKALYTSASLITLNKASWQYGRIEVRAKLPRGLGVWPAIWTLGTNMSDIGYPKCGEIDIMEYFGKTPDQITSNLHYYSDEKRQSHPGKLQVENPYNDFHIYAIEWSEDKVDFFFDDKLYHRFFVDIAGVNSDNPFRKPHYLLVNLALSGSSGGTVDDNNLPQTYMIDYVRVYKLSNGRTL